MWVKLLTDLQVLGREIAEKCVWRPDSIRARWGATELERFTRPSSRYKGEVREGEREGWE